VDPTTLERWERGEREATGGVAARVMRFVAKAEDAKRELGRGQKPPLISGDLRALAYLSPLCGGFTRRPCRAVWIRRVLHVAEVT
jgi:hypothetical protein